MASEKTRREPLFREIERKFPGRLPDPKAHSGPLVLKLEEDGVEWTIRSCPG